MTVIVGLVDSDGSIIMGGDSAATTPSGYQTIVGNRKVFYPVKSPWFVMGFAGSFRLGQLLRYSLKTPPPPGPDDDLQQYMATDFVDAMQECIQDSGFTRPGRELDELGACLVGYQGNLFFIEDDYQVILKHNHLWMTLGTGDAYADGSLFSTEGQPPEERVMTAMKAAARFNAWCREPFHVLRLPFYEDWHRKKRKKRKKKKRKNG